MQRGRPVRVALDQIPTPPRRDSGYRAPRCEADGCGGPTREGKPFCSEHVESMDYVQGILAQMADRTTEIERVKKRGWKAVNVRGPVVGEIADYLNAHGERTIERIAREVCHGTLREVLSHYVTAMKKAKLVTLGVSRRGSTTLQMVSE